MRASPSPDTSTPGTPGIFGRSCRGKLSPASISTREGVEAEGGGERGREGDGAAGDGDAGGRISAGLTEGGCEAGAG